MTPSKAAASDDEASDDSTDDDERTAEAPAEAVDSGPGGADEPDARRKGGAADTTPRRVPSASNRSGGGLAGGELSQYGSAEERAEAEEAVAVALLEEVARQCDVLDGLVAEGQAEAELDGQAQPRPEPEPEPEPQQQEEGASGDSGGSGDESSGSDGEYDDDEALEAEGRTLQALAEVYADADAQLREIAARLGEPIGDGSDESRAAEQAAPLLSNDTEEKGREGEGAEDGWGWDLSWVRCAVM